MTPLDHRNRCACWVAVAVCGFIATEAPVALWLSMLAALLWLLGGWRRDPLWWVIASLVWLRGSLLMATVFVGTGVKAALRARPACHRESYLQAWGRPAHEGVENA